LSPKDIYAWLGWLEQRQRLFDTQLALVGQPELGRAEIFASGEGEKICIEKSRYYWFNTRNRFTLGHSQLFWLTHLNFT